MKSTSPPTGQFSAFGHSSMTALYDGSATGDFTRASQRPYWERPCFQAMPPVVPFASPVIVKTPFDTLIAEGERRPLPAWPGPS